jgi:hypothetical protein
MDMEIDKNMDKVIDMSMNMKNPFVASKLRF